MASVDYTVRQLATMLGRSQPCINNWITRGKLRATRGMDGRWYISEAALAELREKMVIENVKYTNITEDIATLKTRMDQQEAVIRKLVAAVKKLRGDP